MERAKVRVSFSLNMQSHENNTENNSSPSHYTANDKFDGNLARCGVDCNFGLCALVRAIRTKFSYCAIWRGMQADTGI